MQSSAQTNFLAVELGTSFRLWDPPKVGTKFAVEFADNARASFTVLRSTTTEADLKWMMVRYGE
jgi:hypothetical protein